MELFIILNLNLNEFNDNLLSYEICLKSIKNGNYMNHIPSKYFDIELFKIALNYNLVGLE